MKKNAAVPETRTRVVLKFAGAEYEISFGFNDLVEVERLMGKGYFSQLDEQARPTLELARAMLFMVLRRAGCTRLPGESTDLTLAQVGERIDMRELGALYDTLMLAYHNSKAVTPADPPPATGS